MTTLDLVICQTSFCSELLDNYLSSNSSPQASLSSSKCGKTQNRMRHASFLDAYTSVTDLSAREVKSRATCSMSFPDITEGIESAVSFESAPDLEFLFYTCNTS